LITALGIVPDVRSAVSVDVKSPNDSIYIVGGTFKELGGSEYYGMSGVLGRTVPKVRRGQAKKTFGAVTMAIDSGLVRACHDLSEGGLAVSAAEMALAGGYGVKLDLRKVPSDRLNRDDFLLFSESNSRFLVEVSEKAKERFEAIMRGRVFAEIGTVTKSATLCVRGLAGNVVVDISLIDAETSWRRTLSRGA
jgi:phosphoribosylformylglycinamidine synthase